MCRCPLLELRLHKPLIAFLIQVISLTRLFNFDFPHNLCCVVYDKPHHLRL
jgi:hypothetical protein